jgi:hypothetical protein
MNGTPFTHRVIITNSDGSSVGSEMSAHCIDTKKQEEFINEHMRILNVALGNPPSNTVKVDTKNPELSNSVRSYVQNVLALSQNHK